MERFGAVHVVCNNAGVGGGGPTWEGPLDDWHWVLGVNLWGVIDGIRAFVPRLMRKRRAHREHRVDCGTGRGAVHGSLQRMEVGVVALTETLHHELAMAAATPTLRCCARAW